MPHIAGSGMKQSLSSTTSSSSASWQRARSRRNSTVISRSPLLRYCEGEGIPGRIEVVIPGVSPATREEDDVRVDGAEYRPVVGAQQLNLGQPVGLRVSAGQRGPQVLVVLRQQHALPEGREVCDAEVMQQEEGRPLPD